MYTNFIVGIIFLAVGIALVATRMRHSDYNKTINVVGVVVILIAIVKIIFSFIRIVPAGAVGVIDLFGQVTPQVRHSGLNVVNPFANIIVMDIKTEGEQESMNVPSKEGLSIDLDISILFKLSPEKAADIYRTVGMNYREIIVQPQFRSACRGITADYEAKALYTSGREEIAQKIFTELEGMLAGRGIILEKVLLRSMQLPATVSKAIEMKLKAEQESEQMKFVLTKEKQEAERKVIEAEGIAKAQEIINKTLSQAYLQHEAIQAQTRMADSPNHTTVYIPSGDNGIPMVRVLDDGKSGK
jgi:regulator of protease activity HflC (stomatin/prohibitin superfamily)